MARSVNKVILIGNVGKDPDVRYTAQGIAVATFPVATSESWKDKDGQLVEKTDWHNIVAWKKLAEIIKDLVHKGTRVYIEGRLQTRTYTDSKNEKRSITEVVADNLLILDPKEARKVSPRGAEEYSSPFEATSSTSTSSMADDDIISVLPEDDLPF